MKKRNDLLAPGAPDGVEVVQITEGPLPSPHIYMEAQVFSPDSKRFVLHESATAHGSGPRDPNHRYLVCDLEDNFALNPITAETGATAPSVSPDGRCLYYFVNETGVNSGRLTLKRVRMDGAGRETVFVLDAPLPGVNGRASRIYPLSTVRSDGRRIAISCFLGDGNSEGQPWGLLVFDVEKPAVELILSGPTWCNVHPQYCRSRAEEFMRDILVQENHGNVCNAQGEHIKLTGGDGADIHVVKDDGTDFRSMPWGRDGNERCQGHQCWRGASEWAITSTCLKSPDEFQLIESRAVPFAGHIGIASPGGVRNSLSRDFPGPCFLHFGTDMAGKRLVTDTRMRDGGRVFLATLGRPGEDALSAWTELACPRSSQKKEAHIHPFLSPDGRTAFFNSDESGILQAYAIRGLK